MIKWILIDQAKVQTYDIFTRKKSYSINGKTFRAEDLEEIFYIDDYKKLNVGQISERELIANFLGESGLDLTVDEYIELFKSDVTPIDGMEDILSQLSKRFNLAALINEGSEWAQYKFEGSGFRKYFQHSVISGDLGIKKPERAFYERALEIIGTNPEKCLFIDDRQKNCEGAEAVGIKSICFRDANQLRKELTTYGIVLTSNTQ